MHKAGPKVLTVSAYFDSHKGGVERVAGRLALELARLDFASSWLATDASPPDLEATVRTMAIKACNVLERRLGVPFPLPTPGGLARIAREVRRADAVLIHDALYPTSVAAFLLARLAGRPVLVIQHLGEVPYRSRALRWAMRTANAWIARPLLGRADQVVFISGAAEAHFGRVRFGRPPERVYNGVDGALFQPAAGPAEARRRRAALGLPATGPLAVFVGRFVEKKGLRVIEAAAHLRPDIQFVLAGWGALEPEAWGLANVHVRRALKPAEVANLYQAGDVLVLPSVGEGFPLVVQEALASGLPVICGAETAAADAAASPWLAGIDLTRGAAEAARAMVEALDRALAGDTAKQRESRRAFALKQYNWAAAAARYAAMIERLVGERQRGTRRSALPLEALAR